MQIESVAIASLVFDPANARKHEAKNLDAIKGSLARFGQQKPIVVGKKGVIIAGNGTLAAARSLGWEKIDVVYTELTGTDATAFAIADNRTSELAEWDAGILSETLKSLQAMDFDLGSIGFDAGDLAAMIATPEPTEGLTDPDAVPENVETRCKPGDLWVLGTHRLLCGDSTNVQHVERLMGGEKADLVLTDPPYNVASHSKMHAGDGSACFGKQLQTLKDSEWDKDFDVRPAIHNLLIAAAPDCSFYVWTSQYLVPDIWAIFTPVCAYTAYAIWNKTNPMPSLSKRHWTWCVELCVYATRGKHIFNFPDEGNAPNVWTMPKKSDGSHPTQKPVDLFEHIIRHSSNPEQKVLDLFLGSGTTLIACEKTGRRCFGMEIDPKYCDVVLARWEAFTGLQAALTAAEPERHV